jgi:hypothetical protein
MTHYQLQYVSFYDLYRNSVSSSDYIASKRKVIRELEDICEK